MPYDLIPSDYPAWLTDLKARIHQAQQRATLSVNRELVALYWQLGKDILTRQAEQGWGAKVIERLSRDLRSAFPEMKGFSRANLLYMRAFAEAWPDAAIVQQAVGRLLWGHNIVLLTRLKAPEWRLAYARQAIEHGWSRNVLNLHIETQRLEREGKAVTNFDLRLPQPQSDLARESLKDPYRLDFLGLGKEAEERAIESALVQHITHFLIELGAGFAFVGQQVPLEVGGDDFFIDAPFLPPETPLLPRGRTQGRPLQARAHRQARFLPPAPWMPKSNTPTTNPPSASCSAKAKTPSSPNML